MDYLELLKSIEAGDYDNTLAKLYRTGIPRKREQYVSAVKRFRMHFPNRDDIYIKSSPGRIEICGNHTDHQCGRVLCAAIDNDIIAICAKRDDNRINIISQGYGPIYVDCRVLTKNGEDSGSALLVKGIVDGFIKNGNSAGGFDAYIDSELAIGSGLSSSAAFENVICLVLNELYNDNSVPEIDAARISQYAENQYLEKPCGLMDQLAVSHGGLLSIDFTDQKKPSVERIALDFEIVGLSVCVVSTGGSHEDLTNEYAVVKNDMTQVARLFEREYLNAVPPELFYHNFNTVRHMLNDRMVLRAMHFFEENNRVAEAVKALKQAHMKAFLQQINMSGRSSIELLQNIYPCGSQEQPLSLALGLTHRFLDTNWVQGACRVNGGGFGGSIICFMEPWAVEKYVQLMDGVFGEGACKEVYIRG